MIDSIFLSWVICYLIEMNQSPTLRWLNRNHYFVQARRLMLDKIGWRLRSWRHPSLYLLERLTEWLEIDLIWTNAGTLYHLLTIRL